MTREIGQDERVGTNRVVVVNFVVIERAVNAEGHLRLGNEGGHLRLLFAQARASKKGLVGIGVVARVESS